MLEPGINQGKVRNGMVVVKFEDEVRAVNGYHFLYLYDHKSNNYVIRELE